MPLPKGALLAALAFLLVGCDALEQVAGTDSVKKVVRDNPVDPASSYPLIVGLEEGNTVGTARPSFVFHHNPVIASYTLQIAETPDFSGPLALEEARITKATHRVASGLANHRVYHWRVRPQYNDGTEGGWSAARSLKVELPVPTQLLPAASTKLETPLPWLSWSSLPGVTEYEVQTSTDPQFGSGVGSYRAASPGLIPTAGLRDQSTTYWRVRVLDAGQPGDWSAATDLSVSLPSPILYTPFHNASDHFQTFTWTLPSVATARPGEYQWSLSTNAEFLPGDTLDLSVAADPQPEALTLSYHHGPLLTPRTTYYWRIRAQYAHQIFGPWSPTQSLVRDDIQTVWTLNRGYFGNFHSLFQPGDGTIRFIAGYSLMNTVSGQGAFIWSTNLTTHVQGPVFTKDGTAFSTDLFEGKVSALSPGGVASVLYDQGTDDLGPLALGADGTLYFLRANRSGAVALHALRADGVHRWTYPLPANAVATSGDYYLPEAVTIGPSGELYFTAGQGVWAVRSNGTLAWSRSLGADVHCLELVVGKSGVLFLSGWLGSAANSSSHLWSVSAEGDLLWTKEGSYSNMLVDSDGNLLAAVYGRLDAFRPDGSVLWSRAGSLYPKVLGTGARVYALEDLYSSGLVVLDSMTGEPLKTFAIPGLSRQDRPLLADDGRLYVGTHEGIALIDTGGGAVDKAAFWPMKDHDSQGTRSAEPRGP